MVNINIKKYSRSNLAPSSGETEIESNIINSEPQKRSRGRPKKTNMDSTAPPEPIYEPEPIFNSLPEVIEDPNPDLDFNPFELKDASEPFLEELNAENYHEPPTEKEKRDIEKTFKENLKQNKHKVKIQEKVQSVYESSDLFDENGSEIIGRDRRVVINKLNQYRSLFPKELAKFKVKKGASTQELQAYLEEMQTIVETSSYDNFLTDSILQAIKLVENGSKYTRYDIAGCADMLKANPQFNSLMKQMYVKYNVFHKIPCEIQLLLLVTTTAYICSNKNRNKAHLENYLNQPLNEPN
jgi:hypothetical protein